MLQHTLSIALLAGLAIGAASQQPGGKDDLKTLQGDWLALFVKHDGKVESDATKDSMPGERFTYAKHTATSNTLSFSTSKVKFVVTLDPTKSPKQMDLYFLDEKTGAKSQVLAHKAIYEIDEGKLFTGVRIFLPLDFMTARPASFPVNDSDFKGMRLIHLVRSAK